MGWDSRQRPGTKGLHYSSNEYYNVISFYFEEYTDDERNQKICDDLPGSGDAVKQFIGMQYA
jgi:hypothetical protein